MKNNKGCTLIELVICMSIFSVIMLISFNVLNFNLKFYNSLKNKSEIYQQYISIKGFLEPKLYLSSGIENIIGNKNQIRLKSSNISAICYDKEKQKLFFKRKIQNSGYEIGNYVEDFKIENIDSRGVKVYLLMKKDKEQINKNFTVFFKNL